MYNLKVIYRDNSTKFLEEQCKIIVKVVFPNTKQGVSGNGDFRCRKMNKDE